MSALPPQADIGTGPRSTQQLRQLSDIRRDPPRLLAAGRGSRTFRFCQSLVTRLNYSGLSASATGTHITRIIVMSKKAAEHHRKAAEHHTHAAHHHGEAAKHHDSGHHEKAAHHAHTAGGHALHAREHSEEARKAHTEEHGKK